MSLLIYLQVLVTPPLPPTLRGMHLSSRWSSRFLPPLGFSAFLPLCVQAAVLVQKLTETMGVKELKTVVLDAGGYAQPEGLKYEF